MRSAVPMLKDLRGSLVVNPKYPVMQLVLQSRDSVPPIYRQAERYNSVTRA